MGSDGHIAFYDKLKVDKITKEINEKYSLKRMGELNISLVGYNCNFRVNGQYCYVVYWECSKNNNFGWERFKRFYQNVLDKTKWNAIQEFEERIKAEATLVKDQEVWT